MINLYDEVKEKSSTKPLAFQSQLIREYLESDTVN